jgi:ABC-type bacteriocin/lantibiotic exporter with double-glycine peptidase domain
LESDFEILPGGDQTELGERGINLSGGQKARVSLARAVYSERDIILMDDPISALDKKVVKSIFKDLFLDELKGKTRILVTHSIEFLNHFDKIILLKNGRISKVGTYDEVKDDFFIQKLRAIHQANID